MQYFKRRLQRICKRQMQCMKGSLNWFLIKNLLLESSGFSTPSSVCVVTTYKKPVRYLVDQSAFSQKRKSLRLTLSWSNSCASCKEWDKSTRNTVKSLHICHFLGLSLLRSNWIWKNMIDADKSWKWPNSWMWKEFPMLMNSFSRLKWNCNKLNNEEFMMTLDVF